MGVIHNFQAIEGEISLKKRKPISNVFQANPPIDVSRVDGNECTDLQGRTAAQARRIWSGFCLQVHCHLSRSDVPAGRVHGWCHSEPRTTKGQN